MKMGVNRRRSKYTHNTHRNSVDPKRIIYLFISQSPSARTLYWNGFYGWCANAENFYDEFIIRYIGATTGVLFSLRFYLITSENYIIDA